MPNKTPPSMSMENTVKPCASTSAIVLEPANYGASKKTHDRQNIDCVIPVLNADAAKDEDGVGIRQIKSICSKSATHPSGGPISVMYGTSKSKKFYSHSLNRKKQHHQHILNSLKQWNVKIASSGLDKSDLLVGSDLSVAKASSNVSENRPCLLGSNIHNQNKAPNGLTNCSKVSVIGAGLSKKQENRSTATEAYNVLPKKKALQEVKHNKSNQQELSEKKSSNIVHVGDSVNGKKHLQECAGPAAEGFISPDNTYSIENAAQISIELSSECPAVKASSLTTSEPQLPFASKGEHQKNYQSKGRGSATSWGWNQRESNSIQPNELSESKIKGCADQKQKPTGRIPGQGNVKRKESQTSEHQIPNSQNFSPGESLPIRTTQQHSLQYSPYIHQLGQQYQHLDHHNSAQQNSNGTSHHYSFDFLREVGQKMSLITGGTSSSMNSMYRGSAQVNYNFTPQFQQQMMQHYHHTHLQHHQNHNPAQASHFHPPQVVPQEHQQHQHYINRSHNGYGSEDHLSPQRGGSGGAMEEPKTYLNLAGASELPSETHNGHSFETSSYGYNQNGNVQYQQHQQGMHYQQYMPHNHHQHHQVHMNSYQQNNNYQCYNRNASSVRGNQHSYLAHAAGEGNVNREEGGKNGKKSSWTGNCGKGKVIAVQANGGKHFNKVQSIGYGYRKNYQHYHNHSVGGGHVQYYDYVPMPQQQQQMQQQYHKQHLHRNLVYVRGYDRRHDAVLPRDYSVDAEDGGGNSQHETEHTGTIRSVSCSPKSKSPSIEMDTPCVFGQECEPDSTLETMVEAIPCGDDEAQLEKLERASLHDVNALELKDVCNVPRSSSSSSMASMRSNESSAISSMISQAQLLESTHASGHESDSDSSHSSEFRDATQRYSQFDQMNSCQVYRPTSSTSCISSSATNPHSNEFVPSAPSSLHASTAGLSELFVRSHSYHGSHQNLVTYGSARSVEEATSPVGSPSGTLRCVSGTQSVPIFGALFGNSNQHPVQFTGSHSSAVSFESSSSLELALRSSSSSLPASSVPPNDVQSMQSGHPKKRSQSGRTSPVITNGQYRTTVCFSGHNKGQLSPTSNGGRKNNQVLPSYAHRASLPTDFQYTPADRFILRSNDIELKTPPTSITNGTAWDRLSEAIWEKFCVAQQTTDKYLQKMQLWRDLYICIKQGFPKYGLYLVGSTISGFGADSSDVDMCLVSRAGSGYYDPRNEALHHLTLVKNYFMSMASSSFGQFCLIQAKVPILRFQESKNGIEVDLNYNNCVGIKNTHLLHCYSQMDWRVRPLVLVVKLWAQHHNINDAKHMTISSYSLVLMVIHFLQCGVNPPVLPCLHSLYPEKFMKYVDINSIEMIERVEPYRTDNNATIGELLLHFLEYYKDFDYAHYAISVRTASIIPIEECRLPRSYKNDLHQWKHLCIEEPFDLTNTARSVFDGDVFEQIKNTIATSWRMLKDSKNLNVLFGEPLFTPVTSTLSQTS